MVDLLHCVMMPTACMVWMASLTKNLLRFKKEMHCWRSLKLSFHYVNNLVYHGHWKIHGQAGFGSRPFFPNGSLSIHSSASTSVHFMCHGESPLAYYLAMGFPCKAWHVNVFPLVGDVLSRIVNTSFWWAETRRVSG